MTRDWFEAASRGDRCALEAAVADMAGRKDQDQETALMHAVRAGQIESVKFLAPYESGCQNGAGYTALALAALLDDEKGCRALLPTEAKISLPSGITPLMLAASVGSSACIDCLLEYYGAEHDQEGRTALDYAVSGDMDRVVQQLLRKGTLFAAADVSQAVVTATLCGASRSLLLLQESLQTMQIQTKCYKCKDLERYIMHLEAENRRLGQENAEKQAELERRGMVIDFLNARVSELLPLTRMNRILSRQIPGYTEKDDEDSHVVVIEGREYRIPKQKRQILNTQGLKVDVTDPRNIELNVGAFCDYLRFALRFYSLPALQDTLHGHIETYKKSAIRDSLLGIKDTSERLMVGLCNLIGLIDQAVTLSNDDISNPAHLTPLMRGCIEKNTSTVRTTLQYAGMTDRYGRTALMHSAIVGYRTAAVILGPLEGEQVDGDRRTALWYALHNEHFDVADAILEWDYPGYQRLPMDVKKHGFTHLMEAAEENDIIRCFAYVRLGFACKQDYQGRTAQMFAAAASAIDTTRLLVRFERGLRDLQGRTALYRAAVAGSIEIVNLLLEAEHGLRCPGNDWTALMGAAYSAQSDTVCILKEKECTLRATDSCTALMFAAQVGADKCINELVDREAGLTTTDAYHKGAGWTALMIAVYNGHLECVQILLQHEHTIVPEGRTLLDYAENPDARVSLETRNAIIHLIRT
ncbi:Ankyrin repeat protein 1 [Giardia muris]|uniref:Ankyrin repeat protein 1 n=1 Tax=Giardia muris TaxID=5742 RepID=A0A4Z1T885_GIAMU|nr:Ankyrin repeat protein 1 [Giardia muris]|eukprot:TNJ28799.1 Ankyrin repeat protein 1 [Giardia muris]